MPTASHPDGDTDEWEMLLAGYRACAAEAIRFLTEEESVPADSALVLGLWQHLLQQEAQLNMDSLLPPTGVEGDSGLILSDTTLPDSPSATSQPSSPLHPDPTTDAVSCSQSYSRPQCSREFTPGGAEENPSSDETENSEVARTDHQSAVPCSSEYGQCAGHLPTSTAH